ncbi:hypothetical protein B566_EDAN004213 [Ephemera danica]|nr:hypothetical protein B566_EDAN004213 [Ephemera danica]
MYAQGTVRQRVSPCPITVVAGGVMLGCVDTHLVLWIILTIIATVTSEITLIDVDQIQSDECRTDIKSLLRGVDNLEPWAMHMLDASAKLPSGVLRGNIRAFGDYDECVELQGPVSPQFCLADIHVHDAAYPRLHELLERATLGRRGREIMHNRTGYMVIITK